MPELGLAPAPGGGAPAPSGGAQVDVVVLTYRPELGLARCVASVLANPGTRVIVAVNNTAHEVEPVLGPLRRQWQHLPVSVVPLGLNWGYAEGLNRALSRSTAPLVLLLNDDAWLTEGALGEMTRALAQSGARTAGVVPKVMLGASDRIDCVGASIRADGWVANRGYGDIDEGQYDVAEEVAGACFAAVLLRREALEDVGPLWSPFFMYAEDADWCLRARLAGWRFVTCPAAVVRHGHSVSAGTMPSAWKELHVRRNSMLVVVRCFPPRHALSLTLTHLWEALTAGRGRPGQGPDLVWSFLPLLPSALRWRARARGLTRPASADHELFDEGRAAQSRRPRPGGAAAADRGGQEACG